MNKIRNLLLAGIVVAAAGIGMATPAHAAYGGGCDLQVSGTKGIMSLTEHVTSNTCDQPVKAWVLCQPYAPFTYPGFVYGAPITSTGEIYVQCGATSYVVEGGYDYQPTYGSAWVRIQNT